TGCPLGLLVVDWSYVRKGAHRKPTPPHPPSGTGISKQQDRALRPVRSARPRGRARPTARKFPDTRRVLGIGVPSFLEPEVSRASHWVWPTGRSEQGAFQAFPWRHGPPGAARPPGRPPGIFPATPARRTGVPAGAVVHDPVQPSLR